ncbi:ATP-dependent helicase [Brachyspira innocens]|uniref:ATP-dependent helicase n=1 Tax=Brachyspira innocens TaxID=13264 RepID=UPI0026F0510A|nr:ATP-dependent helicase [Brachyspira innocens]
MIFYKKPLEEVKKEYELNEEYKSLNYLNNIQQFEIKTYTEPYISEDYQKRVEYINNIIVNIEKNQTQTQEFIQKDFYKINYKNELNDKQLQAVQTIENPLLIIAGAGTGKTKTLSYRVAYMVENGINQEEILLLTFTRKAAKEMLDRTQKLLELKTINIQGGTFHSFANNILRRYAKILNLQPNFLILDTTDSEDTIDLVKRELKLDKINNKSIPKKSTLKKIISMSKNLKKSIDDIVNIYYENLKDFIPSINLINQKYNEYNKSHNLYDYDDLLDKLYECLKNNIVFKNTIQNKYKYIMVDEFQDTNIVQKLIVDELSDKYKNIMVVGDDSQSIYSFRGANFENILLFPDTYSNCKIIKLEQNYRSNQKILDFTNEIINNFTIGYKKQLFSNKKEDIMPIFKSLGTQEDEAEYIKNKIQELYNNGANYKDIAVLYRSGFHSNYLQKELTANSIPYEVFGGIKFIERKHVRDIISYLRIIQNPFDAISWNRVLVMLDDIGRATASKIIREIENNGGVINFSVFKNNKYYKSLIELETVLNENISDSIPISLKIENLKKYYTPILQKENEANIRLLDIDALISMSSKYEYNLEHFLTDFTLEPPENNFASDMSPNVEDDYVTLSTIHSAKGLEWKYVFIIHLSDGLFPSTHSLENIETLEEERRLFYVATTRAKSKLYMSMPSYFNNYNAFLQLPSRFVKEVNDTKYIQEKG